MIATVRSLENIAFVYHTETLHARSRDSNAHPGHYPEL